VYHGPRCLSCLVGQAHALARRSGVPHGRIKADVTRRFATQMCCQRSLTWSLQALPWARSWRCALRGLSWSLACYVYQ
jgi:hypothetical protein